ncbi:MAG: hypothetical protein PSX80_11155 [bacterium]|nr:hypothetical protein [bacterium]
MNDTNLLEDPADHLDATRGVTECSDLTKLMKRLVSTWNEL